MEKTNGYIYLMVNTRARKKGIIKIGMTMRTPTDRLKEIQKKYKHIKLVECYEFNDTTKASLLCIESIVRFKFSVKYNHFGNDYFSYAITNGKKQLDEIHTLFDKTVKLSTRILAILSK